jgi:hypothetical protein
VDHFCLGRGHPSNPVTSRDLAARGDRAVTSARNSGPVMTSPSGANSIPAAGIREDVGVAWISVSTPMASHASGRTACRYRAIPDFPELEPPLRTIT